MLKANRWWWWKGNACGLEEEKLLKAWDGARQVCCCFWE
jgi:hypothetical protein